VLCAEGGATLRERLERYLGAGEVETALAAVDRRALVIDVTAGASDDFEIAAGALRDAGAYAGLDGERLVVGASAAALARARDAVEHRPAVSEIVASLQRALEADGAPPRSLRLRDVRLDLVDRAHVMGILNVTPDSFYDRGRYSGVDVARRRAAEMVALGASVIDVGGQSYAHWNRAIAAEEERDRVVPVVEALVRDGLGVAISIDTFKSSVAEAALAAGAHAINDCSGLSDPLLAGIVARYDAGLVVMHLKGRLNVRDAEYRYDDAMAEICAFLAARVDVAREAGVAEDSLVIDPGLEFGKEPRTDLEILERFGDLRSLGYPILFAASRKSFIGRVFDRPAKELLIPSLATAAVGIAAGAALVRVHDVEETAQIARMLGALRTANREKLAIAGRMPGT
jgi:dihydropteroate synthase